MKSRAFGSLTTIRTLFFDPYGPGETARRSLDSPVLIRLCGISFLLGGLTGILYSVVQAWWVVGITRVASSRGDDERLYAAFTALLGFHTLLLSAGLLGLHLLLAKRRRWTWRLSAVGTLLAVLSGVGFFAGALYQWLVTPSYLPSRDVLNALFFVGYFGQPVCVVLLGVVVLWTRGLGR